MITENLSTLKIHKLTQAQYDRELAAGNIDETALYLTPDEEIDLSPYATVEQLNTKASASDVEELQTLVGDEKVSDQISTAIASKSDTDHTHNYAGSSSVGGVATSAVKLETVRKINGVLFDGTADITTPASFSVTTSGTGSAYTATVDGITALTAGVSFTMIPHTTATSTIPTLNVNNLGEKRIGRKATNSLDGIGAGIESNLLVSNQPIRVEYDGTNWVVCIPKPHAEDLAGFVPIKSGGTGASTPAEARTNLGVAPAIESTDFAGCYYRTVNGATEWINPPMKPNVEYKTTERWDGNPVYVKRVDYGAMPNTAANSVALGANLGIVSIDGKAYKGNYTIPIHVMNSINSIYYNKSNGNLYIETTNDSSSYTAILVVKYTK